MIMGAVDKAYRAVVARIARGTYDGGTRITEAEISRVAGVSRTPVREALRLLQSEGVVAIKPHCGAIVREFDAGELGDIIELRAALESYAAERAARRAQRESLVRLRALADAQAREVSTRKGGHAARIGELHRQFHHTLHVASGCTRLPAMLRPLVDLPALHRAFESLPSGGLALLVRDHRRLVRALEAGDAGTAARVAKAHILSLRASMASRDGGRDHGRSGSGGGGGGANVSDNSSRPGSRVSRSVSGGVRRRAR